MVEKVYIFVYRERLEQEIRGDGEGDEDNYEDEEDMEGIFENFDDANHNRAEGSVEEEPVERGEKRHAGPDGENCCSDVDHMVTRLVGPDVVIKFFQRQVVGETPAKDEEV